jgi:hypothetical protein
LSTRAELPIITVMGQCKGNNEEPEPRPANPPSERTEDAAAQKTAVQTLIHVLERHLLIFLYTTYAYRFNPTIKKHEYDSSLETIPSPEVPNPGDYDDDGEFLLDPLNHRILIGHLEKVCEKFGIGKGSRPVRSVSYAHNDATGKVRYEHRWEDVEGGTLPAWRPNDRCSWYLERSTTAILEAVCVLQEADTSGRFAAIANLAKDAARPVGHPTWDIPSTGNPEKNIPYDYPALLKETIVKVKDAKTQVRRQEVCRTKGAEVEAAAKKPKRHRATKAEMARRNKVAANAVLVFQAEHGRLPTVDEIMEETQLTRDEVYTTNACKEHEIAKRSAKSTPDMTGDSVHEREQFEAKSIEHTRADRQSKTRQEQIDALADEQKEDDRSRRIPKEKRI